MIKIKNGDRFVTDLDDHVQVVNCDGDYIQTYNTDSSVMSYASRARVENWTRIAEFLPGHGMDVQNDA